MCVALYKAFWRNVDFLRVWKYLRLTFGVVFLPLPRTRWAFPHRGTEKSDALGALLEGDEPIQTNSIWSETRMEQDRLKERQPLFFLGEWARQPPRRRDVTANVRMHKSAGVREKDVWNVPPGDVRERNGSSSHVGPGQWKEPRH